MNAIMKKLGIGNYLTPYLLAACVLLLIILAIQSGNLVSTQDSSSSGTQLALNQIEKASFTAPGIAAFSEITERPLFRPERQPPPEPVQAAVARRTLSPLRLQLEGVAITPESSIALVRDLSTNKMLHLAKGMKHQGWELTDITDTVATFTRGKENQEISLKKDKK